MYGHFVDFTFSALIGESATISSEIVDCKRFVDFKNRVFCGIRSIVEWTNEDDPKREHCGFALSHRSVSLVHFQQVISAIDGHSIRVTKEFAMHAAA